MEVLQGEIPVSNNNIGLPPWIKFGKCGTILENQGRASVIGREQNPMQESRFLQTERHLTLTNYIICLMHVNLSAI